MRTGRRKRPVRTTRRPEATGASSLDASPRPAGAAPLPLQAWLGQLSALELTALEVAVRFRAPVRLADPAGAVVRGLLGERLRDLRCLTRVPTCEGCAETARCDYGRIFAGEAGPREWRGRARDLHPYWLQGPPVARELGAGTQWTARLVVAGSAATALPYLDVALRDALARLGALPRAEAPELSASSSRRVTLPLPEPVVGAGTWPWRLEARTPLVLRGDEAWCERTCPRAPWLALLVRAGIRRLDALLGAFTPLAVRPRVEMPPLEDVEVVEGRLAWWKGSRFSRRQGRRFSLEGLTGSVVLRGAAVDAIGTLLRVLEVTGVGKATSMGFGTLSATPLS